MHQMYIWEFNLGRDERGITEYAEPVVGIEDEGNFLRGLAIVRLEFPTNFEYQKELLRA